MDAVVLLSRMLLVHLVGRYVADWAVYYLVAHRVIPVSLHEAAAAAAAVSSSSSGTAAEAAEADAGIKVIVCGFPRSGTMSLTLALDELGYTCYHGSRLFTPGHTDAFLEARRGRPQKMKRILKGYSSIVGLPSIAFIAELMEAYPKAKVILHRREPEEWYESCAKSLHATHTRLLWRVFRISMWRAAEDGFFRPLFQGRFRDKEWAMQVYKRRFAEVKQRALEERRLVLESYEVKDGWQPLCSFLGVPVPSTSFPRTHNTVSFLHNMRAVELTLLAVLAAYMACLVALFLTLL